MNRRDNRKPRVSNNSNKKINKRSNIQRSKKNNVRSSRRIRKYNKSKNLGLLKILGLILLLILALYIIMRPLFSSSESRGSGEETNDESEISLKTEDKIAQIDEILSNAQNDLTESLDSYIRGSGLEKEKIKIGYAKLGEEDIFEYGSNKDINHQFYNYYLVSMLIEDLARMKKIDLNQSVEIDVEGSNNIEENQDVENDEINQSRHISLSELLKKIINQPSDENIAALEPIIDEHMNGNWKYYANNIYGLDINRDNEMTLEDTIKSLQILVSKNNDQYVYRHTISAMMESANQRNSLFSTTQQNFVGVEGTVQYNYTIENAFILSDDDLVYVIQTDYSEASILNQLRSILINWHNAYK